MICTGGWHSIKRRYVERREQGWWIAGLGLLEHEGFVLFGVAVAGGEHAAVDVAEELGDDLGVGAAGEFPVGEGVPAGVGAELGHLELLLQPAETAVEGVLGPGFPSRLRKIAPSGYRLIRRSTISRAVSSR